MPPNPEQSRSLVVHFPRIRSVFIHGIYPFKDDVLFRGHNCSIALNRCIRQIIEVTNTSTTIRVFKSAGDLSANVLLDGISSLSMFASVQTIDVACCHLEFADIVTILRHAPFIRSLHCPAAICVPEIKGMHCDELPEYMCITGRQFGNHFGFLTVIGNKLGQAAHLVETIALVAIAFSQRVRFTLICNDMSGFSTGIKTVVDSEPFAKYVDQIEAFTRHN
ncbi:hypothetical protein LPJ66_008158 [Kickxella alabastrina]|uniref:Uncharacterized protein n=1 Tax=Kickxella alabastrina TaxID=61397 RepID=A0ACC1IF41_9FUNG|nr:hypothetical protein LPJ66_008158 [Kickxella alabastrina]